MNLGACGLGSGNQIARQVRTNRISKGDMRDDAVAEERWPPAVRMVDELAHHHQVSRRDMLLHAAGGAHRNQRVRPEPLHPIDVGAIVQFARQYPMATAMAREKDYLSLAVPSPIIAVRGRP